VTTDESTRGSVLVQAKNAMTHIEIRAAILTSRLFLEVHPEDQAVRAALTELFDRGIALATAAQLERDDDRVRR
jgi:hypothetical protein